MEARLYKKGRILVRKRPSNAEAKENSILLLLPLQIVRWHQNELHIWLG